MNSAWSDEQIHAHVDGELDAPQSAQLEADSRADSTLAARIARQRALRERLQREFDPVLDEPVPGRLLQALDPLPTAVTPIGAARGARTRPAWSLREWGAIAASLALGAILGAQLLRDSQLPIDSAGGEVIASGYLAKALSTQLSAGTPQNPSVRVGMSFRSQRGEYCRTFSLRDGAGGLSCRREGRWVVEVLEGGAPGEPGPTYRQAASALSPAMLAAISGLGAAEPLSQAEERQGLESGWKASAP